MTLLPLLTASLLVLLGLGGSSPAQSQTLGLDTAIVDTGRRSYLEPNAPNPFAVATSIYFSLAEESEVRLTVYDFFYQPVAVLVEDEVLPAGRHLRVFAPRGLPSGMYFYELATPRYYQIRRLLFVK